MFLQTFPAPTGCPAEDNMQGCQRARALGLAGAGGEGSNDNVTINYRVSEKHTAEKVCPAALLSQSKNHIK
jgi:hypothetical protein